VKTQFASVVNDQDGATGHLGACAGCGGHGDQRGHAVGDLERAAFDGGVGLERPLVRGRNAHTFGAVDGRAATQGDQAVAVVLLVNGGCGAHSGLGRVGGRLVEHADLEAGQGGQRLVQDAHGLDARIGHDQGAGDAHSLALGLEQADRAKVDLDLGDVIDERHAKFSGVCAGDRPRARGVVRFAFILIQEPPLSIRCKAPAVTLATPESHPFQLS
jgi:hypothetical protein